VGLKDSVAYPFAQPAEVYNGLDWDRFGDMAGENDSIWIVGSGLHTGGMGWHSSILVWDGTSWRSLDSGVAGPVRSVARYHGKTYVGGSLTVGSTSTCVARLDGPGWTPVGEEGLNVAVMKVRDGTLYVGGNIRTNAGDTLSRGRIVRWDGDQWMEVVSEWTHPLTEFEIVQDTAYVTGTAPDNQIQSALFSRFVHGTEEILAGPSGQKQHDVHFSSYTIEPFIRVMNYRDGWLYVGGRFDSAGGQRVNDIARFNGTEWQSLAGGVGHQNLWSEEACNRQIDIVEDIDFIRNQLVVVGQFSGTGLPPDLPENRDSPGAIALLDLETLKWSENTSIRGRDSYLHPGTAVLGLDVHGEQITIAGNFDFVDGVRSHNIATTDRVVSVPREETIAHPMSSIIVTTVGRRIMVESDTPSEVEITIYDLAGRKVEDLFRGRIDRGRTTYQAPTRLSGGAYLVQVCDAESRIATRVAILP
jgi:hypothetical protein